MELEFKLMLAVYWLVDIYIKVHVSKIEFGAHTTLCIGTWANDDWYLDWMVDDDVHSSLSNDTTTWTNIVQMVNQRRIPQIHLFEYTENP